MSNFGEYIIMFRFPGKSWNRKERRVIVTFWKLNGPWNKRKWRGRAEKKYIKNKIVLLYIGA